MKAHGNFGSDANKSSAFQSELVRALVGGWGGSVFRAEDFAADKSVTITPNPYPLRVYR